MLESYVVLDLTDERGEIGPMLLGDLGADVIRIEGAQGSDARRCAPSMANAAEDMKSLQFIAFNRNKRSRLVFAQWIFKNNRTNLGLGVTEVPPHSSL